MFTRMMYTTLVVSDLDRALDFYTGGFGFLKWSDNPTNPEGRFLTMRFEGQDIGVILAPGTRGQDAEVAMQSYGELFIQSDDLRKDFEALRSKGVRFVEAEPEDYAYGVRVTALDPDGNRIALREPPAWARS